MVGVSPEQALSLARRAHAQRVQVASVSPREWLEDFPLPCAFTVGVTPEGELEGEEPDARHLLMLDTSVAGRSGGTGRVWPWAVARPLAARRDVLLAGGLNLDNVAHPIPAPAPFRVDASAGPATGPGR